jgi:hypothetical protein
VKVRIAAAAGTCVLATGLALVQAPIAAAAQPTFSGNVTCANNQPVVGVWITSSGGGSRFAQTWTRTGTASASYTSPVATGLPTSISLHVGCGGNSQTWGSDNFSPPIAGLGGSASISVTNCVNGQCSPVAAYGAAQWALNQVGTNKAPRSESVTDSGAYTSWSGLCLAFVASAYLNAGDPKPSPYVDNVTYGYNATAESAYQQYKADNLIQHTWSNSSGTQSYPPEGALVFYPGLGGADGHVAISAGGGNVVSANENGVSNPLVQKLGYNSPNLRGYYAGWAFPINAGS